MPMPLIPIGNKAEPSAYKKTMLAAAHRFLPGALKAVLQTTGVQGVLTVSCFTDCIDSLLWSLPNSLLLSKRTVNCSVWAWCLYVCVLMSRVVCIYVYSLLIQVFSHPKQLDALCTLAVSKQARWDNNSGCLSVNWNSVQSLTNNSTHTDCRLTPCFVLLHCVSWRIRFSLKSVGNWSGDNRATS